MANADPGDERLRALETFSSILHHLGIEAEESNRGFVQLGTVQHVSYLFGKQTEPAIVHTTSDLLRQTNEFAPDEGFFLSGMLTRGGKSYTSLYVIQDKVLEDQGLLLNIQRRKELLDMSEMTLKRMKQLGKSAKVVFQSDVINSIPIHLVKPELLPEIAADNRLSRASKVASALFSVFPWTLDNASAVFHAQQYDKEASALELPPGVNAQSEEGAAQLDTALRNQFHQMVIAVGTLCLCYGYSQDNLIAKQISRRLAAAYADANLAAPDWDTVANNIKEWAGSPREIHGEVVALIGRVLALHRDGSINPSLAAEDEALSAEDPRLRNLPPIFNAVRDQMLLVYTNYQSSTIRWALQVLPLVEEAGFGTHHRLGAEIRHLKSIKGEIEGRKYVGLVSKIATRHQQQQFPMMSFIGCMYHSMHLETEDQKAAFRDFNLTGISQKVADVQSKPVCDAVLKMLPAPHIEAKASLMKGMSALDVERVLSASPEDEVKLLKERLRGVDPPCDWAIHDAKEQAAEAKKKFYQAAALELNTRWEKAHATMMDRITMEANAETRQRLAQGIQTLRAELLRLTTAEEMSGSDLMKQLQITYRADLEEHWKAGMAVIQKLREL
ncbi:hypothetical protein 1 [Beihai barnacle virus 8]|uniref:Uncharacterized protein n=1 Tax=Beihai barnacle virus 8 TaxID=1922366 RepID=A0A1L3KMS4_9MONO|nr:hypothetical protein 1 [Beihai barnacle virus 8]APG78656.1 hypothetical protein 1 [Beihai barnacle virus 8]